MMRVKICGIASRDDVDACITAGADALGFIFARSPRRLTLDAAAGLTAAVPPFVTTVGVFAGVPADVVRSAIDACRLDVLQFSGEESAEFCGSFGKPTIVATRSRPWDRGARTTARAVAVMIDSWTPAQRGGTGRLVPRQLARRARAENDGAIVVLAGGLTAANVAPIIRDIRPDAVDARTGVEREGKKDPALVRAFVFAARSALAHQDDAREKETAYDGHA